MMAASMEAVGKGQYHHNDVDQARDRYESNAFLPCLPISRNFSNHSKIDIDVGLEAFETSVDILDTVEALVIQNDSLKLSLNKAEAEIVAYKQFLESLNLPTPPIS